MSERALRGSRLGVSSYESDEGVDVVPRQQVPYACPQGHRFSVPFSLEAEVPVLWECRLCGAEATIANGDDPGPKALKPPRTHWDMLLERREVSDLEDLLQERLTLLRTERERFTTPAAEAKKPAKKAAVSPQPSQSKEDKAPASKTKTAATKPAKKAANTKSASSKTETKVEPESKPAAKKAASKSAAAKSSKKVASTAKNDNEEKPAAKQSSKKS